MQKHWTSLIELRDRRPPWMWGDDTLALKNSPFGKRFRSEHTPWIREPLALLQEDGIKEETCMGAVQCAKTMLLIVAASWAMRYHESPMMINCQSDDDARDFAKEKFNPTIESVPEIKERLPHDQSKRSTCFISLPDMFCIVQGANLNNLQSKSIRWQFNDEVFLWSNGLLDHARKRTTQYWNRKILNVSTAGDVGSELDRSFLAGDQREYHFYCGKCSQIFWPRWPVIKWEKQDDWDFNLLKKSTYLECPNCLQRYEHTDDNRLALLSQARYVAMNAAKASPGHVSHRWNATVLQPEVLSWGDLAVEWVKAEIEFNKGNDAPRKEFITKRLAESYDPNYFMVETKLPRIELQSSWPEETFRFLTVDVQEIEFWAVVRAWANDGSSHLLWAGRLFTYDEIEAKANEFQVSRGCVFIDSSWDTRKVYLECAKRNEMLTLNGRQDWFGWKALNGEAEARKSFVYKPAKGKPVLLPYSYPAKYVDPMAGRQAHERRYAKLYFWSNIAIKDILKRLRDGKGAPWVAYEGVPKDWNDQMFSERRIAIWDKWNKESYKWERIGKRANHLWDCECMQVVAACIAGVIGDSVPSSLD